VLLQTSYESPIIFTLILRVFCGQPLVELKKQAAAAGVCEADFTSFLVFSAAFFDVSCQHFS
jgi:dipeptidyl-peptidase-3